MSWWGPKRWGPNNEKNRAAKGVAPKGGAPKGGAPKGGGPRRVGEVQIFALFSVSRLKINSLCSLWVSSRGILVVFKAPGS